MEKGRKWLKRKRLQLSEQERVALEELSTHNKEGGCGVRRKREQAGASKELKRKKRMRVRDDLRIWKIM